MFTFVGFSPFVGGSDIQQIFFAETDPMALDPYCRWHRLGGLEHL
jgi:hypothetical protein